MSHETSSNIRVRESGRKIIARKNRTTFDYAGLLYLVDERNKTKYTERQNRSSRS